MGLVKQTFQFVQLLQGEVRPASSLFHFGRVVISLGFVLSRLVFAVRVTGLVEGASVVVVVVVVVVIVVVVAVAAAAAVAAAGGDGCDGGGGGRGVGVGVGGGGGDDGGCVFSVRGGDDGADAVVLWHSLGLVPETGRD